MGHPPGHDFEGISDDTQGVAFDQSGNLYGAATGTALYPGGIFRLDRRKNGGWRTHVIFKFALGASPGMVAYGAGGKLCGTSFGGGKSDLGAVFRIMP